MPVRAEVFFLPLEVLHGGYGIICLHKKFCFFSKVNTVSTTRADIFYHSISHLQGQWHKKDIFFDQYFLFMSWWFSRSFKSFSLSYTIFNFLFASLKLLINFENTYWNPPQNSLLCDWSMFSHWLQGKCAKINLSPAALCIILQNLSKLTLWIWFFHSSKKQSTVKNYHRMYRKYIFIIISLQKNTYFVIQSL
jgi:hypothetical protein